MRPLANFPEMSSWL